MDRKEMEQSLMFWKDFKGECERNINQANSFIDEYESKLKAQLESETVLNHGDYGLDGANKPWLATNPIGLLKHNLINTRLGNIFDDLKALTEPIEEFEDLKVSIDADGDWRLVQGGEAVFINPDKIQEFILNLRRMQLKK